jgi:hypothetical protein
VSASRRFVDLVISVRVGDAERANGKVVWSNEEELIRVGGRWDRRRRRWVRGGRASECLEMRFHRGQEEAARWFAAWLRRFASNDWTDVVRVFSVMLIGGRRSGKTHVCCAVMIVFSILSPRARLWAISPTLETGAELDAAFAELLPARWYKRRQAKTGRSTTYRFANGSTIHLRSAVNPARLKAGRVDIALLNEAQEMTEPAYLKLRGAVVDRGGLVLVAANPPDRPGGRWVEQLYLKAKSGKAQVQLFVLDPRKNPLIVYEALLALAAETTDQKTLDRDVLGLFVPIGDTVFYAWSDEHNWIDPPPGLIDVTPQLCRSGLGRAAGDGVGMDFQATPAMVGVVGRFLRPPHSTDPLDVMLWIVDEAVVDEADENDLADALEEMPRWRPGDGAPDTRPGERDRYRGWIEDGDDEAAPRHAACVLDASAWYQDGEHTKGRTSDRALKARRWRHLYKPQRDSDVNPAIIERMKLGNSLLKAAAGRRRLFIARHCIRTAEAMREYENKNGFPNRRSKHAHIVDAVTYLAYRFFGRPRVPREPAEYRPIGRFDRGNEWR